MQVIKTSRRIRKALKVSRCKGSSIGFVPTMGALHEGHLSLIRAARRNCDIVVVSIFVNPAQFSPHEDLKCYPRQVKKDLSLCRKEKVDFVFLPKSETIYPKGYSTYVYVEGLSERLCARQRPGHFRGVTTIVTKLFNIVQPDIAYFGQKDAQQSVIIKKLVKDLDIPVDIKVMPTVRERSGLALSSRNAYLSGHEQNDALVLSKSLDLAGYLIRSGLRDSARIIRRMTELIGKKRSTKVHYIEIVNPRDLSPVRRVSGRCLIAMAVNIGKTRLIDNRIVYA
jgi:pantoate--beta-alanine ligase